MSRNELPEKAPEGIDDQTWFFLHETLRKFDSAINRLDENVSAVFNEPASIKASPLIAYPAGEKGTVWTNNRGWVHAGPLVGEMAFNVIGWPVLTGSLSTDAVPDQIHDDVVYSNTFAAAVSAAGSVAFTWVGTLPPNFTGWNSEAIKLRYRLILTGVAASSTATVALGISGATSGPSNVHEEVGGTINAPYPTELIITNAALDDGKFGPNRPYIFTLTLTRTSAALTSGSIRIGRFKFDWK